MSKQSNHSIQNLYTFSRCSFLSSVPTLRIVIILIAIFVSVLVCGSNWKILNVFLLFLFSDCSSLVVSFHCFSRVVFSFLWICEKLVKISARKTNKRKCVVLAVDNKKNSDFHFLTFPKDQPQSCKSFWNPVCLKGTA